MIKPSEWTPLAMANFMQIMADAGLPDGVAVSYVMRVFDQLVFNVDRNLTNLLIIKSWDMVMIDTTRSFRLQHTLENPKNLGRCDRTLLANLRALDKSGVDAILVEQVPDDHDWDAVRDRLARATAGIDDDRD